MSGPLLFLETLDMESTGSHERVGEWGDDIVERERESRDKNNITGK